MEKNGENPYYYMHMVLKNFMDAYFRPLDYHFDRGFIYAKHIRGGEDFRPTMAMMVNCLKRRIRLLIL
jgi:hypothetical protein